MTAVDPAPPRHDDPDHCPRCDRTPPNAIDAERSLIGAALLHAPTVLPAVANFDPAALYLPTARHIWNAITTIGPDAEPVIVAEHLRGQPGTHGTDTLLDEIGGVQRIAEHAAHTGATSNAPRYAAVVTDRWRQRQAAHAARDLIDAAHADDWDAMRAAVKAATDAIADGPGS